MGRAPAVESNYSAGTAGGIMRTDSGVDATAKLDSQRMKLLVVLSILFTLAVQGECAIAWLD